MRGRLLCLVMVYRERECGADFTSACCNRKKNNTSLGNFLFSKVSSHTKQWRLRLIQMTKKEIRRTKRKTQTPQKREKKEPVSVERRGERKKNQGDTQIRVIMFHKLSQDSRNMIIVSHRSIFFLWFLKDPIEEWFEKNQLKTWMDGNVPRY